MVTHADAVNILARQKRGVIYAGLIAWPPGLGRIVVEYAVSASELVEEYALQQTIHPYVRSRIWREAGFLINIMWRGSGEQYTLEFRLTGSFGDHYEFVNDFARIDLIGVVKKNLVKMPYHREAMLAAVHQMIGLGMKANIAT